MLKHATRLRVISIVLGLAFVVISASIAVAGDFWVNVEAAHSSRSGLSSQTVLVVRPGGCHEPENAVITATAEGLVNGQRKSLPLELTAISPGVYEINRQWPSEGAWVVAISAEYRGLPRAALVRLGPGGNIPATLAVSQDGHAQNSVQSFRRRLAGDDIDSALQALASERNDRLGRRAAR
jgi:hypothetical protein